MSLKQEGSMDFWLKHPHRDWATNDNGYRFGPFSYEGITCSAIKHPNRTIEISVRGPFDRRFTFRYPMPQCDERGLHVAITWKDDQVKLYLNGKHVGTQWVSP